MEEEVFGPTLAEAQPEVETFDPIFSGPEVSPIVRPDEASLRAQKFDYALKKNSPGLDAITNDILSGNEASLRDRAVGVARSEAIQDRQNKILGIVDAAKTNGRPLNMDELKVISQYNDPDMPLEDTLDPSTYLEKAYAKRLTEDATKTLPDLDPEDIGKQALEKFITRKEIFQNLAEETNARYDGESSLTKIVAGAKTGFIPFYMWYKTKDIVDKAPTSSVLQGSNILEQIQYLHTLEPEEAGAKARLAVEQLYQDNPGLAAEFAQYLISYSASDEIIGNVASGIDVASVVPFGALARGTKVTVNSNFVRGVARNAAGRSTNIPGVLDASGQTAEAGFRIVVDRFKELAREASGARVGSDVDLMSRVDPLFNPQAVLSDAGQTSFSNSYANRLQDILLNQSRALIKKGIVDPINITRLEPGTAAYNEAMDATQRLFNLEYPHASNAIIAVRPIRSADNALSNSDHIAVQIGRKSGELFDTEGEARILAKHYNIPNAEIKERGAGFYIEVTKTVDETLPSVRNNLIIDTQGDPTPRSLANRFFGWIRTSNDLLPERINQERNIAASGAAQLTGLSRSIMERAFRELGTINNASRRDLQTFLEHQRDTPNAQGVRGLHSPTIGAFERDWMGRFNRLPTEQETTAYFTYKQVNDAEWTVNNLSILKGKQRLGFENFSFKKKGVELKGPPAIEGKLHAQIPWDRQGDAGILVWDHTLNGQPRSHRKDVIIGQRRRQELDDLVNNQGYRVIELSEYGEDALRQYPTVNLPRGQIKYVLVKEYESAPLSLRQIPYRPGGHVDIADEFFISQPRVHATTELAGQATVHDYRGDWNILSARTQDQAIRDARVLEEARKILFVQNNPAAARTYIQMNSAMSWQEFRRMWSDVQNGFLDPQTPIFWRQSKNSVEDQHKISAGYSNFNDAKRSAHNSFNEDINMRYAQERNDQLTSTINTGTALHPIWNSRPSRMLDPFTSASRGVSSVIRGKYMDDLKIKNAERFVAEFGHLLNGTAEEIRRYPWSTLMKGDFKEGMDPTTLAAAKNFRRASLEFMGVKNQYELDLSWIEASMVRWLGDERGGRWFDSYLRGMVESSPLETSRVTLARAKLGLWNPKQFLLQGLGVAQIAAIEGPVRASQGWAIGNLMHGLHLDRTSANLKHNAKLASKLGMSERHFVESYEALQRTGFQNVGGEYANIDDITNPQLIRSAFSQHLDDSSFFFKKGEQMVRLTAWNAAYLRWREANPLIKLNDQGIKEIRNRADLLAVNMTNASNSSLNNDKLARIPTQFFSYHHRLTDLMMGRRLTPAEKSRLVLVNSLLYGVPTGVVGTALGAFVAPQQATVDFLRGKGVDLDNTALDFLLKGLPQTAMKMIGGENAEFNFSETFGPNGLSFIRDLVMGRDDKGFVEMLTGAQGTFIKNNIEAFSGFGAALLGSLRDDETYFPMTKEDFIPILEEVSGASNAVKAYYAYVANAYLTKNKKDVIISNVGTGSAITTLLTGMVPDDVSKYYQDNRFIDAMKEAQARGRAKAITYYRLASDPKASPEDIARYVARATYEMRAVGMTYEQKVQVMKEAGRNYEDAFERQEEKIRNLNETQHKAYIEKLSK